MIERFGSGGAYESLVGYSRTVRAGEHVFVAGCTATGADGVVLGVGDAAAQAREALDACERGLDLAGARLADVVRTRVYLDWRQRQIAADRVLLEHVAPEARFGRHFGPPGGSKNLDRQPVGGAPRDWPALGPTSRRSSSRSRWPFGAEPTAHEVGLGLGGREPLLH